MTRSRLLAAFAATLMSLSLAACDLMQSHEDEGHANHGGGIVVTNYSEATEVFVEYRPLVVDKNRRFDAHLTWLDTYEPVTEGTLTAELTWPDGSKDIAEAGPSDVEGIFRPLLTASKSGPATLRLVHSSSRGTSMHELGEITVWATSEEGAAAVPAEEEVIDAITFSKDEQSRVPFRTDAARMTELADAIPVTIEVRMQPQAEAIISAPVDGIARAPRIYGTGSSVRKGQTLASISSTLGGGEDIATLDLSIQQAIIERDAAVREVNRMQALVDAEAVPARRLDEANTALRLAEAQIVSARQRRSAVAGGGAGVPIISPISGEVLESSLVQGMGVTGGQQLMRIGNPSALWLVAQVPEALAGRAINPSGIDLLLPGQTISLGRGDIALVQRGAAIDQQTRTLPVIFAWNSREVRPGQRLQGQLRTGAASPRLTIPASAILNENGQDVVYVQVSGETFQRRPISILSRSGDLVSIEGQIEAGDRVVTRGAAAVRAAAAAPDSFSHGHAH